MLQGTERSISYLMQPLVAYIYHSDYKELSMNCPT